jgi:hypothetical protein
MKTSSRIIGITAVVAALCIAPDVFAKPKEGPQGPEAPGAPGAAKQKGRGKSATRGPSAPQNVAPQARAPQARIQPGGSPQHRQGPIILQPPMPFPPPPRPPHYGHRTVYRSYVSEDSNVAAVQRALKNRGYYSSSIDGDAGPGTRAAIRSFREDNGLGSSSRIDSALLRALGL